MRSDKKMAILITAILVVSAFAFVMPVSAGVISIEANKTVWNPVNEMWVKELTASVDDTLRFNCTIHNSGGANLSQIRFWDILDCSLNYSGDATLDDDPITLPGGNYVFKPKVLHPANSSWDLSNPRYEDFTELCPEVGIYREIVDWEDTNYDGNVSVCDQIQLTSEAPKWYHVDRVPYTLNLSNEAGTKYFDSVLNWDEVNLTDPNGTKWLEVCCCKDRYTLLDWQDAGNIIASLSPGDIVTMRNERTGEEANYTVEEVTKDLVVSKEWEIDDLHNPGLILEPCQTITIEYDATVVRCGVDNNTFRAKGWYGESSWYYSNEDLVTITVPCVSGEATDPTGNTKEVYTTAETVYATGSGFDPNSFVNVYITEDKHWVDGMTINSTVYAREDNVSTDANGNIVGEEIWPNPIPGEYDMIFDQDRDGFYNVGRDAVDNPNDPGFTVVGQAPALTPIGLIALVGLLTIIATSTILRKRKKR